MVMKKKKDIILLGSTGSIGETALRLLRKNKDKFNLIGVSAHNNVRLLSKIDKSIKINTYTNENKVMFNCDKEQLSRVFFNIIKNSIESIQQKSEINPNFEKKILIEILYNKDHIKFTLVDNGIGFGNIKSKISDILNPYFTTKKNGTGLGLSIVNKIINDHNGELNFFSLSDGAKVEIIFKLNGNRNSNSWR